MKPWKWLSLLVLVVSFAGCGLNPPVERTPDGFDPPYDYY